MELSGSFVNSRSTASGMRSFESDNTVTGGTESNPELSPLRRNFGFLGMPALTSSTAPASQPRQGGIQGLLNTFFGRSFFVAYLVYMHRNTVKSSNPIFQCRQDRELKQKCLDASPKWEHCSAIAERKRDDGVVHYALFQFLPEGLGLVHCITSQQLDTNTVCSGFFPSNAFLNERRLIKINYTGSGKGDHCSDFEVLE
ncbi:unnamed protein product [Angiostrongylus costaricensis]|uniref:Transmembrane protein n=1 Tax=Angiostrongylus costaricensis TaxID=334426 RepID=A0A0R3PFB3_ANGCS|nr:unnamed protein product [Angiostrongylus costaricensis]